jgi:hypothetical protein
MVLTLICSVSMQISLQCLNCGNETILTACKVVTCILRRDSSSWRLDTCFSRDEFWTASCSLSDPSCSDRSFSCSACRCSSNLTCKKRNWRRLHKQPHNFFPFTQHSRDRHGRHEKRTQYVITETKDDSSTNGKVNIRYHLWEICENGLDSTGSVWCPIVKFLLIQWWCS